MAQATNITPEDLVARVDEAQGNITLASGLELRSAYNRGRLTPGVLESISARLETDHRIGVLDNGNEPSQEQLVYLYKLDAPVGQLLSAAVNPSEAGARRLREVATPARKAVEADQSLLTVKAALEDATTALRDYLGGNGRT